MSEDSSLPREERRVPRMMSGDGTESGLLAKCSFRTVFVVAALSFHSVIEGMTTGFPAVSMHKYVIAFSLGLELLAEKVKLILNIRSTLLL